MKKKLPLSATIVLSLIVFMSPATHAQTQRSAILDRKYQIARDLVRLEEYDTLIRELGSAIAERDELIGVQTVQIKKKGQLADSLSAQVKNREEMISQKNGVIDGLEKKSRRKTWSLIGLGTLCGLMGWVALER